MTGGASKGGVVAKSENNSGKNRLYYGDNLDVLRNKIVSESVDLCYIDQPFNSKRNYFQIYNNQGGEDRAQAQAFVDTWEWGDEAVDGLAWITDIAQLQNGKLTEQTLELIKMVDETVKLYYMGFNRTSHASAPVCAPGGSFFALRPSVFGLRPADLQ
jgi:DNA modification methylase